MTPSAGRTQPSVLVTDDTVPTREVIARILGAAGYVVETAAHGPDALMRVEQRLFDLYVVDVAMPMMTGQELARLIKRYHPAAKVLYVTAFSPKLFGEVAVLPNNEAFLQKPFSAQDLREAVSLLLFGHLRGLQASETG